MPATKSAAKKPAAKKEPSPKKPAPENPFITVESAAFARALSDVTSVVEARSTLPILSNLMISQRDGTVHLCATNLDMEIRMPHDPVGFGGGEDGKGGFSTTVAAKHLHSIFQSLDDGAQAQLQYDKEAMRIIVTSGAARFKLPVLPTEDFPQMSMDGEAALLCFTAGQLRGILHRHAFAQSTEEARYYLNGIHMHRGEQGALHFAATDGHNLAHERMVPDEPAPEHLPKIIMARASVAVLEKLLGGCEDSEIVEIEVTASKIQVAIGVHLLIAKLIDGEFPDYSRVIPASNSAIASVDRAQLLTIAKRVQILADAKSRAVRCDFTTDKLTLTVKTPEYGEAKEEMPVSYGGPDLAIGVNGKYLLAQLAVHGGEAVTLAMEDPRAPVRIESVGTDAKPAPEFLTVIMPMAI